MHKHFLKLNMLNSEINYEWIMDALGCSLKHKGFTGWLIPEYQIVRLQLSRYGGCAGNRLSCSLRNKRLDEFFAANAKGKIIPNSIAKCNKTKPSGSANFFWTKVESKLLSSTYSCLRLVNAFTQIVKCFKWLMFARELKPINGLATNISTAKQKRTIADLNNCIFVTTY